MTRSNSDTLKKDWPQANKFKKSIRIEFTLYISGMILILMLVTGYIISNQYINTVTQNVIDKLLVQTRSFSGPAGKLILSTDTPDALLLNNICKKLSTDNADVYWAGITGNDDIFMAHTDIKQVISGAKKQQISSDQNLELLRQDEVFSLRSDTILIKVPIVEKNVKLGKFVVAASTKAINIARTKSVTSVVTITIIMILIGIPITMLILHRKLRPVSIIAKSLRKVDFENIAIDIPLKNKNEFGYLAETMRVMGNRLNFAQKEIIEKERISRELEIAREIQANMLPDAYPVSNNFEFAGTYRSAREVGGDYYDFLEFDENHIGIVIADVSGKSLPGMLVMLLTRDIVKRVARKIKAPEEILIDVNEELVKNIKKGMFVTMFIGVLDKQDGTFNFASAGHNPLVLIRAETVKSELIKTKGFPLGMMPSKVFEKRIESATVKLKPGDIVIQYTDGINEAQNEAGEEYGMDRFVETLVSNHKLTVDDMTTEVLSQHQQFVGKAEQYDDITMLSIKNKLNSSENNKIGPQTMELINAG
jgi:serine phosphatase RsbU (regulator of sigma subunit)